MGYKKFACDLIHFTTHLGDAKGRLWGQQDGSAQAPAAEHNIPSSIPRTHVVEGES